LKQFYVTKLATVLLPAISCFDLCYGSSRTCDGIR